MGCFNSKFAADAPVAEPVRKAVPSSSKQGTSVSQSQKPRQRIDRADSKDEDLSSGSSSSSSEGDGTWDRDTAPRWTKSSSQTSNKATSMVTLGSYGNTTPRVKLQSASSLAAQPAAGQLDEDTATSQMQDTKRLRVAKLRGCTFVNQYMVIRYLGRGASGRVFLCIDIKTFTLCAVKIVKKVPVASSNPKKPKRDPLADLQREIAIMRMLDHPNIVALREVVDDPENNKILIVMEFLEGGPILPREMLERGVQIPETIARPFFRDMILALRHVHSKNIIHGDLKPENALMGPGRVCLSDFGCSKLLTHADQPLSRCNGTPAFLAPEMMKSQAVYRGKPTDLYAMGACLFTFIYGKIPFMAPNVVELFKVVQSAELVFPDEPVVSDELKDLLAGLLVKNPEERFKMQDIVHHPWVTKNNAWPLIDPSVAAVADADAAPSSSNNKTTPKKGTSSSKKKEPKSPAGPMHRPSGSNSSDWIHFESEEGLETMLDPSLQVATVPCGEYLIRQGDRGRFMLYILEGDVEVLYCPTQTDASELDQLLVTRHSLIMASSSSVPTSEQSGASTPRTTGPTSNTNTNSIMSSAAAVATPRTPGTSRSLNRAASPVPVVPLANLNRSFSLPASVAGPVAFSPFINSSFDSAVGNGVEPSPRVLDRVGSWAMDLNARSGSALDLPSYGLGGGAAGGGAWGADFLLSPSMSAVNTPRLPGNAFDLLPGSANNILLNQRIEMLALHRLESLGFGIDSDDDDEEIESDLDSGEITIVPVVDQNGGSSLIKRTSSNASPSSLSKSKSATGTPSSIKSALKSPSSKTTSPSEHQPQAESSGTFHTAQQTVANSVTIIEDAATTSNAPPTELKTVTSKRVAPRVPPLTGGPLGSNSTSNCTSPITPNTANLGVSSFPIEDEEIEMSPTPLERAVVNANTTTTSPPSQEVVQKRQAYFMTALSQAGSAEKQQSLPATPGSAGSSRPGSTSSPTMQQQQSPSPQPSTSTSTISIAAAAAAATPTADAISPGSKPTSALNYEAAIAGLPSPPTSATSASASQQEQRMEQRAQKEESTPATVVQQEDEPLADNGVPVSVQEAGAVAATRLLTLKSTTNMAATNSTAPGPGHIMSSSNSINSGTRRSAKEFVVAVRGPGEFVGEMGLLNGGNGGNKRCASVRAKSQQATVVIIPYNVAKDFIARKPVAKYQLEQMVWNRKSENMVLEALAKLVVVSQASSDPSVLKEEEEQVAGDSASKGD